jgi:hypothetical protein
MRNLAHNHDHEAQAFARLLQQFQDEGNFGQLVAKLASRAQGIEDVLHTLIEGRYLANAFGETLNQIGSLVGQPRPLQGLAATDDNAYRVLIYGRIAANISHGTIPDLLNLLGALQARRPRIFEIPDEPSITLNFINGSSTLTCGCVRSILTQAKASVALDITQHDELAFAFEGDASGAGFDAGKIGANP